MQVFLDALSLRYVTCHNSPTCLEGWSSEGSIMFYLSYYIYLVSEEIEKRACHPIFKTGK